MMRGPVWAAAFTGALALSALAASGLGAQAPQAGPFTAGIGLLNTQPLAGLRTGPGIGIGLMGAVAHPRAPWIRLRADLRLSSYGMDRHQACLSQTVGCWIQVDITTNYHTIYGGIGPELAFPVLGSELVVAATGGVGYFGVSSSLSGVDDGGSGFGDTTHFDDAFFAWSAGSELRVPVSRTVALAAGVQYQHNGRASYVVDGGVTENPDGSLNVPPVTGDANLVAITLGVAIRPQRGGR
jgi:hypothetical protein